MKVQRGRKRRGGNNHPNSGGKSGRKTAL